MTSPGRPLCRVVWKSRFPRESARLTYPLLRLVEQYRYDGIDESFSVVLQRRPELIITKN